MCRTQREVVVERKVPYKNSTLSVVSLETPPFLHLGSTYKVKQIGGPRNKSEKSNVQGYYVIP